jgi:GH24 family phage-related lysozyme (muramidase)
MSKDLIISKAAIRLILDAEGFSGRVDYPGGASGPTIGIGYDLAYHTAEEIRSDWGPHVSPATLDLLLTGIGQSGERAMAVVVKLRNVRITRAAADAVFMSVDVPRWIRRTAAAFPGYEDLPDDAQGALVSLAFNRGAGMGVHGKPSWDSRREMRSIRSLVALWKNAPAQERRRILAGIAEDLRSMQRLWKGKGLDGLIARREAEAKLVEAAIAAL